MTGGWLFGYVEALLSTDLRPVLICVSIEVERPRRRVHRPTGATLLILPAPRVYRWLRRRLDRPYANRPQGRRRQPLVHRSQALQVGGWLVAPWLNTPLWRVRRALRSELCGVAICQEYEEGRFDLLVRLARVLGVAVVAVYQGGAQTRTPVERLVRRRSVHAATALIIGASRERERVATAYGLPSERVEVIANPVEIPPPMTALSRIRARRDLQLDPAVAVVVWYGRVDIYTKGLDVLVDAWRLCCEERPHMALQLLLVGDGPGGAELHRRIDDAELRGLRRGGRSTSSIAESWPFTWPPLMSSPFPRVMKVSQ